MPGCLYVVSTPIGNLDDLSARARETLEQADRILCEDTRRTGLLLHRLGIDRPLLSLHEHNERRRLSAVCRQLEEGARLALVSDAGTPLLSDPGFLVVREAAARGLAIIPIPGPAAPLAALVASGLPPYPFTFCGFPPPRRARRRSFYQRFRALDHTLVLFESPHRLLASLTDALEILGDRPAALGRELTKLHEEVLRGSLSELRQILEARPGIKGEFVLVVAAASAAAPVSQPEDEPPASTARRGTRPPRPRSSRHRG